VLTSLASLRIGPADSPSVVQTDQSAPAADTVTASSVVVPEPDPATSAA